MNVAKLISNGHTDAYNYGISFFYISLEEIHIAERETLKRNAISSRASQTKDFHVFLKQFDVKNTRGKQIDHQANLDKLHKKVS